MRLMKILTFAVLVGLLGACSNPHKDAAKAQKSASEAREEVARERLSLVDKYQACVKEAADDNMKVEACDSYLKAAEALK